MNNHARGNYTTGKEIVELALDRIRADNCTLGLLRQQVEAHFLRVPGAPGGGHKTVVEPYNAVFSTHALLDHTDGFLHG